MRTLHRPMFNMGGPIKEGVMHGIREPYKGGQLVRPGPGRPGYAGLDPRKNVAKRVGAWGASKIPGFTKGWAKNLWNKYKFPPRVQPATPTGPGITTATKARDMWHRAGQYFKKHPYLSTLGPAYLGTTEPVAGTAKAIAGAVPEIAQFGTEVLTPKRWEKYLPPDDWWKWKSDVEWKPGDVRGATPPPGDDLKTVVKETWTPGGTDTSPILTKSMRDKVAQTAKDRRVNELLEMMGHKQSKKDAVYNALLDASQIVGAAPGGKGLDISKDIIQPIIGATSQRFDKPKEIEEAVRLMQTKAEIEKDIAAGKGGTLKQNAKDLVNAGVFKDETAAMKHLASKKTMGSVVADVSKQFGVSGANAEVLDTSLRIKEEVIPQGKWKGDNKVYKEFKNNNKDKADIELEFVGTIDDRKAGDYYIVDKRIVLVDENLNPEYYY